MRKRKPRLYTGKARAREETPAFVQMQQEFEEQGVQFVGVSVDDSPSPVRTFVDEFGVPYPIAVDDGTVQAGYKEITGYPTTYLINRRMPVTTMDRSCSSWARRPSSAGSLLPESFGVYGTRLADVATATMRNHVLP